MIINRHNYEECFILYWDNELSASQRQAVENFVKENQDLQEEFNILGQTRFVPDNNIQLEKKEFLLNNSFINITNYEEQLLNYIDDEVTADQRKEIESFTGQYSVVKQELALLQKTKLQPEAEVIFPDKSILYRREEKVRVISMTWFRVAVAAAIILIAGFATFRLINNNKSIDTTGVVKNGEIKNPPANNSTVQPPVLSGDKKPINNPSDVANAKKKIETKQPGIKDQDPVIENKLDNTIASNKRENKNNLPEERKVNDNSTPDPIEATDVIAAVPNNEIQKIESAKTNNLLDNSSVTKSTSPSFANISDISDENDRFEKEKDKGGIKEFLRKTTRVFERRTRIQTTTDDNKLLVGAFAVSLK